MRKTVTAALAAIALLGTLAASASDAEARRWGRFGVGIGLGLITTGIAIATEQYDEPTFYRECKWVERYSRSGAYLGVRKICRLLPY
ncbi:MAG TPA: hypothetical protein VHG27_00990 [Xanthobacteraceae bacterium]|nr:hypothetical protein [Xanthobacteraceae bacterium]